MGRIDVEIETVLALVLQVRQQPLKILVSDRLHLVLQFWHHLGANGCKFLRFSCAAPRLRRSRWRESQEIDRGLSVRHSWKHEQTVRFVLLLERVIIVSSFRLVPNFFEGVIENSPPPFLVKLSKSWRKSSSKVEVKKFRLKWKYSNFGEFEFEEDFKN